MVREVGNRKLPDPLIIPRSPGQGRQQWKTRRNSSLPSPQPKWPKSSGLLTKGCSCSTCEATFFESAKVFLNDLYVVVCKKRAALIDLESELFPYKIYNPDRKEAKK